jgi:hypothetical protein
MACNVQTRNLGPRNILLGKDTYQQFCLTAKADVSGDLENKFFVIHEPVTQLKHVFYFEVGGSGSTDPLIPNSTSHKVSVATNASATVVASAIAAIVDALTWVSATATADHVDMAMTTAYGKAYPIRDALADASKTKFTFVVTKYGSTQEDLGGTEGSVKMTLTQQNVEIKTPQTGNFVLGQIRQGVGASVSFSLQDTSVSKIRQVLDFYGSTVVPDNGSGKVLSGYGSANLFSSTDDADTQLILRPSSLAGIPDASQDFTFPKASLQLGELEFAGDKIFLLPVVATAFLDTSDNSYLNFFSYGDKSSL